MNKKLMVGALAVALIGGGIAGAALLPSTNAASSVQKSPAPVQQDNDQETNDDGVQGAQVEQGNDQEVNDDGVNGDQGAQDNDQEVNDDGVNGDQGAQDDDKEVNDAATQTTAFSKQQSIDIALKQTPGTVTSANLETENGKTVYAITIKDAAGKEQELTVDATTGKIIPEND
ncbi:PepSY domain-containing protein [Cohnella silvisoli]|uniref:PepSY domain-containing protein n=1 Tax=Cohnella silvisoli TaxID=2873699 RepID=A0ABV1KU32_9BACL|nr:PepSY domain-containing protein [Cohnella silvisoli]MCD9022777.1 PepSY domain-containing protein [Cohnella silvisoli]